MSFQQCQEYNIVIILLLHYLFFRVAIFKKNSNESVSSVDR